MVALRKGRVSIAGHAGRRTATGRENRRDHVGEVGRLPPRLRELRIHPAVVAPRPNVIEPRRFVPGQPDATFVVRIEGDRLPVRGVVEVVGVAEPVGDDAHRVGFRVDAQQSPGHRILHRRRRVGDRLRRDPGIVSAQQVQRTVRTAPHRVGRMLAIGFDREYRRRLLGARPLTTDTPVALQPAVDDDVEHLFLPEQPHRPALRRGNEFHRFVRFPVVVGVDQLPDVAAPCDDDASVGVDVQGVDVVGQLRPGVLGDLESWRQFEAGGGFGR